MATVTFYNNGNYKLLVTNREDNSTYNIAPGESSFIKIQNVQLGDVFDVENLEKKEYEYRPIFIVDETVTEVRVHGNIPYRGEDVKESIQTVDFESNLFGLDLTRFKPRLISKKATELDTSVAEKPIFSGLQNGSVDYHYQGGKRLKTGMSYSAQYRSYGSKDVKMDYSYSSFSRNWSIGLGVKGSVPVKGVTLKGALDLSYNRFTTEERSSRNVYAYTMEQKHLHTISLDAEEAYLDTDFIKAVKAVSDEASALDVVEKYGTHYPKVIYYGGDRSAYMTMNSSTYAKAKGFGIDIKGEVGAAVKEIEVSRSGSVSYQEKSEQKEIFKNTKIGYQSVGGQGNFDSWDVTEENAVAIEADLEPIYTLVEAKVFKDGTLAGELAQQKVLIERAVNKYLGDKLQSLGEPLPAPRIYSVNLDEMRVTSVVDDANKKTKGTIRATVSSSAVEIEDLWKRENFTTADLKYQKNQSYKAPRPVVFALLPSSDGTFQSSMLQIHGDIYEDDHAGGSEHHHGNSRTVTLENFRVGDIERFSFDCTAHSSFAEKGTIRVTITVRREESDFEGGLFYSHAPDDVSPPHSNLLTVYRMVKGEDSVNPDRFFQYQSSNGSYWSAHLTTDGKFLHTAKDAASGHIDSYIAYVNWQNQSWTATFDPVRKVFTHTAAGASSGHGDANLFYLDWEGNPQVMRLQAPLKVVAPPSAVDLYHTPKETTDSVASKFIRYRSHDGSRWTATLGIDNRFTHIKEYASSSHNDIVIAYVNWQNQPWTATIDPEQKVFIHTAKGAKSGHEDANLFYLDWDGRPWVMRLQETPEIVASPSAIDLYHTAKETTDSVASKFIRYQFHNGARWTATLSPDGEFTHTADGASSNHSGNAIGYVNWQNQPWTATVDLNRNVFIHTAKGAKSGHADPNLFYLDWDGKPWVMRLQETPKIVAPPSAVDLYHTAKDETVGRADKFIRYQSVDGSRWTATLGAEGKFTHTAEGASTSHSDVRLGYVNWKRNPWLATADLTHKVFVHTAPNASSGHADVNLYYLDWAGNPWVVRIA